MNFTQMLLGNLPQGGIVLLGNTVVDYNSAALRLLVTIAPRKTLTAGQPLPAPLGELLEKAEDSGLIIWQGKGYSFSRQQAEEYTLLLIAKEEKKISNQTMNEFLYCLRDALGQTALGLDGLAQQVIGVHRERVCTILKAHYSMVRALEHLELLRGDRLATDPVQLELVGYCQRLETETDALLKEMGVTLVVEPKQYALFIQGEEWLLQRLILGLMANAIQKGGRNLKLRLSKRNDRCKMMMLDDCPVKMEADTPESQLRQTLLATPDCLDIATARRMTKELGGTLLVGKNCVTLALPLVAAGDLPIASPDVAIGQRYQQMLVEFSDLLPWTVFGMGELE